MPKQMPMDTTPFFNDRVFPLDPIRDYGCRKVTVTTESQTLLELLGIEEFPEAVYAVYISFSSGDDGRIHYNPMGPVDVAVNGALYSSYPVVGPDIIKTASLAVPAATAQVTLILQSLTWRA